MRGRYTDRLRVPATNRFQLFISRHNHLFTQAGCRLIGHKIALHAPGPCITANIGALNLTIIDYYFRLIMKMRQFENLIENG